MQHASFREVTAKLSAASVTKARSQTSISLFKALPPKRFYFMR